MNILSALILTVFILLTGATATGQDTTPEVTVSASEVTVDPVDPSIEEDAWASFDASQITMPASEFELSVTYMRTMDGNFEYSTSVTEFPVWSITDPTKVHIFRVAILHHA